MMKLLSLGCLSCTHTINMGIVLLVLLGLLVVSAEASWIGILLIIQPITKNAINAKARSAGRARKA